SVQSGLNFARYCDKTLDGAISKGKTLSDQMARATVYHQAQRIIHDQALWLPLAHPTVTVLAKNGVEGYQPNPFGRQDFSKVSGGR
ncbi:hypothetical protein LRK59_003283, partial [Listeria monocytogenes]|nr:hypothetical protein [Listeria monocytogenes]